MGFSLKEALKTLCGRNQWSYAVFWKIGCHNSKLLIWEECYYEPLPCHSRMFGMPDLPYQNGEGSWCSSEARSSQLGVQEEDRVSSLISKMSGINSVVIAGEGIIGRVAFTGSHQWILLNNLTKDAYPPEVYAEVHHQFSAGMQTVAVIPVLPHGVVQLGSFLPIIENMGFVNDVKSLILQLGCVPGALLSANYSEKNSVERLAEPAIAGVPVSPVINPNCTTSLTNSSSQKSNSSYASRPFVQTLCPLKSEINTCQRFALTPKTRKLNQISSNPCQPKAIPMSKTSLTGERENKVVEDEVIPSNLDSCLQQHSASYNERSAFNNLTCSLSFGQSGLSDDNVIYMEQQTMSAIGNLDDVNPCISASSTLNMSQLKTDGGHIFGHKLGSGNTLLHGGMSSLLRSNLITSSGLKSPKASTTDLSGAEIGIGLQNWDSSTKAGASSLETLTGQPGTFLMHVEGSDQKILPIGLIRASTNQKIDYDLLQTPNIPSFHAEEHVLISGQIPGSSQDYLHKDSSSQSMMTMNPKNKLYCTKPPSGDDLFDVLGVDLKNKLLNGNSTNLFADESDANGENVDKKVAMDVQVTATNPDNYSVKEAISDCGIFSGMGTDHLLDAVVSKAKSIVKQDSDEISCWTTLTRNSTSSVPSHACKTVMSDHVQQGLFDFPKRGGKSGATETSFLRSGCNKNDAGTCSQTSSVYGSQLSSWVENVKLESSVSTGYSKRPDEACKPNRKRLKPGENPRPRPKDRQMIQDRVKELREIVPNGAKCSIDALLERTIKHMLFLQSVIKHADKLKQTGETKIINKEDGLLLKDNFEGGATWAYEVGSQSMVCPIIVEDLNSPRQMLVEMLCEERGFFLEIADLIKGLGLTILKGVMEAHNDKIWARFAVEANRDVTRMEIFMSLVRLLEQPGKGNSNVSSSNAIDNMMMYHSFPHIAATRRRSS
ncbi:hypothetical protein Fmac_019466 [Flemingia macrophylla]|uniref:BHLH domain-containing protein n=1 Tax=Flemingia macrophylla TaxID=520843 RepID=A0ABD1M818_9FABA